jgi:hypothetical protein
MIGPANGPRRVGMPYLERLAQTLSARDWAIIASVHRLRLASGLQLERLHFNTLTDHSRSVMRWRVLKRLSDSRVLIPLERRIGTAQRGAARLCYGLDTAGQHLVRLRANLESPESLPRRPRLPGERFMAHTLAVSELYVTLAELSRSGRFEVADFQAEAVAYWPDGRGGWMKPDAWVKLRGANATDYWWYEDLATESLPTIRAKLLVYLDFVSRGQLGPEGIVPRVLIGVPNGMRQAAIESVLRHLPEPAEAMFLVATMIDAAQLIIDEADKP